MKIVHFSTDDIAGGAAKAAHRLHSALRGAGHQSLMIVKSKKSDDDDVRQIPPPPLRPWQSRFKRVRQRIPGLRKGEIVANYTFNFDLEPQIDARGLFDEFATRPDIVCLHWITGFLNSELIRKLYDYYLCPLVWVIADQEPMTGGCHYSFGCNGFKNECGSCPQLNSTDKNDLTRATWLRKKRYLAEAPICFVAPTSWGIDRLKQSSLFGGNRVELIPIPLDLKIFRPFDRQIARDLLHLPLDKKVLFFGATYLQDRRKGMKQLIASLGHLAELVDADRRLKREDIFLLIAGLNGKEYLTDMPFAANYAGHLNDEVTIALAYQSSDLFLCPSIEESGPMMIPEAMLCGTPVVAFRTGGAPDLIETMRNGYLAKLADPQDFARGIFELLKWESLPAMRLAAREAAIRSHTPSTVAQRHINLYQSLRHPQIPSALRS